MNLCAGMAFLLLSNMALACQMSSHYEKLDDVWKLHKVFIVCLYFFFLISSRKIGGKLLPYARKYSNY